jgi:hypothetical protein
MRSTLDIDPPLLRALGFSAQLRPRVSKAASSDFELACATRQDIFIDFRWAERNYARLADFAAELIRLKVDVLVTYGTPENPRGQNRPPQSYDTRGDGVAADEHYDGHEPRAPRWSAEGSRLIIVQPC